MAERPLKAQALGPDISSHDSMAPWGLASYTNIVLSFEQLKWHVSYKKRSRKMKHHLAVLTSLVFSLFGISSAFAEDSAA